ncbi:MAG: SDR family NAD(P)-dependent oxidoreductase [Spirochaetia bacterium]
MRPVMKGAGSEARRGSALVTGASRGIGKAIASALAAEGWEVTGTCRNPKRLAPEDRIPGVRYLPLDFSRKGSAEALLKKVKNVDVLVSNAGSSSIGPVEEAPIEKVRALFEDNFIGAVRLTQSLLPRMRARGQGAVIFIGSMAGEAPRAFSAFYAASKAALRAFAECLRMEVSGYGVRVALVAPWSIATTIQQENQMKKSSPYAAAVQRVKQVRDRSLMAGADPQVVAEAVMDLLGKRRPRAFTSVGHHARLQAFLVRHLPRRMIEALSARRYKV